MNICKVACYSFKFSALKFLMFSPLIYHTVLAFLKHKMMTNLLLFAVNGPSILKWYDSVYIIFLQVNLIIWIYMYFAHEVDWYRVRERMRKGVGKGLSWRKLTGICLAWLRENPGEISVRIVCRCYRIKDLLLNVNSTVYQLSNIRLVQSKCIPPESSNTKWK